MDDKLGQLQLEERGLMLSSVDHSIAEEMEAILSIVLAPKAASKIEAYLKF